MEYIHRVVGRLVQPMQDANVSSRLNGSSYQRVGEQGIVDVIIHTSVHTSFTPRSQARRYTRYRSAGAFFSSRRPPDSPRSL